MQGAIMKSFTYEGGGGNGAGVILLDKQISSEKKQEIAAKIGLSETAFILQRDEKNFDVSFFTPVCEVDLCGHATIAAFYFLGHIGVIKGLNETQFVHQNTKAGKLEIEIKFDDNVEFVMMQQQEPQIFDELIGQDLTDIAESLNIIEDNIGLNDYRVVPTIVSTGLKDIIIPVKNRNILNSLNVDLNKINDISNKKDVVGYHVYTVENGMIYTRNFAPRVGIDEECATGTSNGALCSLLYNKKIISADSRVIQGEAMNEKSLIYVRINDKNDTIDVRVGGKASIVTNSII